MGVWFTEDEGSPVVDDEGGGFCRRDCLKVGDDKGTVGRKEAVSDF